MNIFSWSWSICFFSLPGKPFHVSNVRRNSDSIRSWIFLPWLAEKREKGKRFLGWKINSISLKEQKWEPAMNSSPSSFMTIYLFRGSRVSNRLWVISALGGGGVDWGNRPKRCSWELIGFQFGKHALGVARDGCRLIGGLGEHTLSPFFNLSESSSFCC